MVMIGMGLSGNKQTRKPSTRGEVSEDDSLPPALLALVIETEQQSMPASLHYSYSRIYCPRFKWSGGEMWS